MIRRDATGAARPTFGILLFDDVEVLDFAGPYEVLSEARDERNAPCCTVVTVAPALDVTCRGGLGVHAARSLDDAPELELLVVPGGPGTRTEGAILDQLVEFVRAVHARGVHVASVCTGAFILARAGVLNGLKATTHSAWMEELRTRHPLVHVVGEKVVDEGKVITSAGIISGVDLALHLVGRWFGTEARARSAERLDGPWR